MEYENLTSEKREQMYNRKLLAYESQHYDAVLNKQTALAIGNEAAVERWEKTIRETELALADLRKIGS